MQLLSDRALRVKGDALRPGGARAITVILHHSWALVGFWASLVAHLVENLPAMRETWVRSLGWEDLLEKEKATHSIILAWRIPYTVHGVTKSGTRLSGFRFHFGALQSGILQLGFSRQEYWSGLPFPSPGDLSDPAIEPGSPALHADALSS